MGKNLDEMTLIGLAALSVLENLKSDDANKVKAAMEDHLTVVDHFYRLNEDLMVPQQYEAAKKDFDYFLRLVALAMKHWEWEEGEEEEIFLPNEKATLFVPLSKRPYRIAFLLLLLSAAILGFLLTWDMKRLDEDFTRLYKILGTARLDAFYKETTIIVRFNGTTVTVTNQNDSKSTTTTIPTLAKVDYDTDMGHNMIVYTWRGTADHNKRIHGGSCLSLCWGSGDSCT
jgi:hypothetical protein